MSIPVLYPDGTIKPEANGLGRLFDATRVEITEKINDSYELEIDYPTDSFLFSEIQKNRVIYADDQFFQIYEISRPLDGEVTVYAEHVRYRLNHIPVLPFTASGTPEQIWAQIKAHAVGQVPFSLHSDISTIGAFVIDKPRTISDILLGKDKSFLSVYQGEFEWNNWQIDFVKNRGKDLDYQVRYGINLTDLKQEENLQSVDTEILPYATVRQEKTQSLLFLPEKTLKTKYADNFSYSRILSVDFSQEFENDETPTVDALRDKAKKYVEDNKTGIPKTSLDVSFVDLNSTLEYQNSGRPVKLYLGDRIKVIYESLGVDSNAEITQTTWDVLEERYTTIHLGDFQDNLTSGVVDGQQTVNTQIDNLDQTTDAKLEAQKEETKRKLTEVDERASKQVQTAQKKIREVEEKVGKKIDENKQKIQDLVSRNSNGSPLEFYDEHGNIVQGIPPVATIKSKDGKFELNSSGFNWDNHIMGAGHALYADGIYGETITGYDINGAHINGGTINGVTIEGQSYFRSSGSGGIAVMSGDDGFSFGNCAVGSDSIKIGGQYISSLFVYNCKLLLKKAGMSW